jgi:toxin ParE1/3/4
VSATKLVLSDAAALDIAEQADWYHERSGSKLARRWERAVASSLIFLAKSPRLGARCRFKAIELQEVRRISISGFPKHLIFYRVTSAELLVLRVLHGARDLEALLSASP